MIDHLLGRPSSSWKRTQVFLVIFFWLWQILRGRSRGPRLLWLRTVSRKLERFTPWQIIVSTLTAVYAFRNLDKIIGFGSPEPLANLYSPSYYRATWIVTGLDAGFATAMTVRPKWLRDLCSVLFSAYYIIYANEADEKLRKFRAVPTVEMLRTTWEKTTNPYIRLFTPQPPVCVRRKILLPRPRDSTYKRPISAWLFFAPSEDQLSTATELILDAPGGGFIAMTPEHHEDRLRMWTLRTGKPVLAIDYGKAPEYPYPCAIDEIFDTYRVLFESAGKMIGMSGKSLSIIMSGDSAGAAMVVGAMIKIIETRATWNLPSPAGIVLNYACLDFNFTSWMSPANLRVLRSEQSSRNIPGLAEQKDHFGHISPLSMVGRRTIRRRRSWRDTIKELTTPSSPMTETKPLRARARSKTKPELGSNSKSANTRLMAVDRGALADEEDVDEVEFALDTVKEKGRPIQERVPCVPSLDASQLEERQQELIRAVARADSEALQKEKSTIGTRITMTSRTGYFQDRIISPSMMRAMAILYIGPHRNPDFATDYHISPILAPSNLLAQFPPLLMQCGEKDPFVDDTVIFAGRVREAKRERMKELDVAIAGKSVKFGENLRMSNAQQGGDDMAALKRERDQLAADSEEDWVQMVIFSDWSHGYLQMPALMHGARAVINDIADWMDQIFNPARNDDTRDESGLPGEGSTAANAGVTRGSPQTRDISSRPISAKSSGLASETEADEPITFIPKRRTPPPVVTDGLGYQKARPLSAHRTNSSETVRGDEAPSNFSGREDQGKSTEITDELESSPSSSSPEHALHLHIGSVSDDHHNDSTTADLKSSQRGRTASPRRPAGPGSKGTSTPTISETELMRRRRLLDSHIFE